MLTHLYLRDFTIIESLELDFLSGMSALTGETGAGKSIILDAIHLVLGSRGDTRFIRHQADRAEICLSIHVKQASAANQWLTQQALEQDNECIIRRIITRHGKSRAWINGTPVTINQLKQLGETIIDIHGQHEHQILMRHEKQCLLVDEFAGNESLLNQLKITYQQWKAIDNQQQALAQNSSAMRAKKELLTFQTKELDELNLKAQEYEQLNDEHHRLASTDELLQTMTQITHQLYEDEQSLYSLTSSLTKKINYCQTIDASLSPTQALFDSLLITIQEAFNELRTYQDQLNLDPERLQYIEQRIGHIQDLSRKHGVNPEQLVEKTQSLQKKLNELMSDRYDPKLLETSLANAKKQYLKQAKALSLSRQRACKTLSKQVSLAMQELGMKGGIFAIDMSTDESITPSSSGIDRLCFMVSANPGQPLRPLNKVASGGELSRISLAIQMITAQKLTLPTLIFDEVDSGIGGGVAESVGKQLRKLGDTRQILCITHLAQVAAQAHQHYKVTKIKTKLMTQTGITLLSRQQRIHEIARMMGGAQLTDSTLKLAQEMLINAKQ